VRVLIRFATLSMLLTFTACRGATEATSRVTYNVVAPAAPCRGCTLDAPSTRTDELPLLVTLHGDREHASSAAEKWRAAALARGFVVLSLECPADHGCSDGKWYMANLAPAWVSEQIDMVARDLPIDRTRRYLAGWSGGASYAGMNAPAWDGVVSAVVYHGGGQPPLGSEACPPGHVPAYFLVGDANPAHAAAQKLKNYLTRCNQPVTWDLLPGAGHKGEADALDRAKADRILTWLDAQADGTDALAGS
jgi:poly(3-hydroxybutyrate) depolymerase